MHSFSGIKLFWPGQNNEPVIDVIKRFNSINKAFLTTIYDFPTLYTNIPDNKLKM